MEMYLRWSNEKNDWLIKKRGVSFDELALAIQSEALLDDIKHPVKNNQRILLVWFQNYVWALPYVKEETGVFLKTAFKSRKYKKRYGDGEDKAGPF
ncbi:MAG: toxin [Proteobacteria bacterium]|nr:toxin [Pseudomonadota bacterium]